MIDTSAQHLPTPDTQLEPRISPRRDMPQVSWMHRTGAAAIGLDFKMEDADVLSGSRDALQSHAGLTEVIHERGSNITVLRAAEEGQGLGERVQLGSRECHAVSCLDQRWSMSRLGMATNSPRRNSAGILSRKIPVRSARFKPVNGNRYSSTTTAHATSPNVNRSHVAEFSAVTNHVVFDEAFRRHATGSES